MLLDRAIVRLLPAVPRPVVQKLSSRYIAGPELKDARETVRRLNAEGKMAMPLGTYAQARPWAEAIKEETLARRMPPWPAERGYGTFANDIGLTRLREPLVEQGKRVRTHRARRLGLDATARQPIWSGESSYGMGAAWLWTCTNAWV